MRKIFFLFLCATFFNSCSNDNSETINSNYDNIPLKTITTKYLTSNKRYPEFSKKLAPNNSKKNEDIEIDKNRNRIFLKNSNFYYIRPDNTLWWFDTTYFDEPTKKSWVKIMSNVKSVDAEFNMVVDYNNNLWKLEDAIQNADKEIIFIANDVLQSCNGYYLKTDGTMWLLYKEANKDYFDPPIEIAKKIKFICPLTDTYSNVPNILQYLVIKENDTLWYKGYSYLEKEKVYLDKPIKISDNVNFATCGLNDQRGFNITRDLYILKKDNSFWHSNYNIYDDIKKDIFDASNLIKISDDIIKITELNTSSGLLKNNNTIGLLSLNPTREIGMDYSVDGYSNYFHLNKSHPVLMLEEDNNVIDIVANFHEIIGLDKDENFVFLNVSFLIDENFKLIKLGDYHKYETSIYKPILLE